MRTIEKAMGAWRAGAILGAFFVLTVPLMPVQAALLRTSARRARTFPHWYHRQVGRLLGMRIVVDGEVARDRPVLLIANHTTWLDIPVLSALAPVSFVAKKEKNCDPDDPADDRKGDTWDHVAIDAESRLIISVVPGERTAESVVAVVGDFKRRTGGRLMDLITTDGYPAYAEALLDAYGETITPPRTAEKAVPITQAQRRTVVGLMPTRPTNCGSSTIARMLRPISVRLKKSVMPIAAVTPTTTTITSSQAMLTPATWKATSQPAIPAASRSSSSTWPSTGSPPRAATFSAATSERATAPTVSPPATSRSQSAPPM